MEGKGSYVGIPEAMLLEMFGDLVRDAFGLVPYLVGSATTSRDFRDVDVRMIMPKGEDATPQFIQANSMAWTVFGKYFTNLPIDFQVQNYKQANAYDGDRFALFTVKNKPVQKKELEQ